MAKKISLNERAIALDDGSKPIAETAREIAEQLNVNPDSVRIILVASREGFLNPGERTAQRLGFSNATEYRDNLVRRREYDSLSRYAQIRAYLRGNVGRGYHNHEQEKFEQEIELKPLEEFEEIAANEPVDLSANEPNRNLLNCLTQKEQSVLRWRYFQDITLEKVGEIIGTTRERARQIEEKAIEKLQRRLGLSQDTEDEERDVLSHEIEDGELLLAHILSRSQDYRYSSGKHRNKRNRRKIKDTINDIYYGGRKIVNLKRVRNFYEYRSYQTRLEELKKHYLPRPEVS